MNETPEESYIYQPPPLVKAPEMDIWKRPVYRQELHNPVAYVRKGADDHKEVPSRGL